MNHIGIKRADYKGATQKNIAKKRNNNMDPRQITRLAKLLRDNGDKVLSSEYKITLTGQLLRALNDSFTLITDPNETCTPNTFQVLKPNNAKSEVFRDLQIIYDFVQKAQILCLVAIPTEEPFDGDIDIKKFRNLKRLEIQKIPIEQIVGIQRLRAHLQELICSKSINSIQSIVSHCGGDNANGFLWNELKMADFSYNCLKTIDCSLEFVSNLQQLNLSHNQIHSVDAIKWLPNLKKLNLSFNNLSHIPQSIASRRLQSLILMNNFIENLSGLPKLEALNELNLADNCILDHAALEPLGQLIALQQLTLHGNPISHHPHYREETCKYLHKNVASVKFILDSQPLNKHEKSLVGYYQSFNNWSIKHRATKPKRSSGFSTPASRQNDMTPASSIGSFRSFQLENSMGSTVDLPNELSTSQISSSTQKKIKVRPALIADDDNDDGVEVIVKSKPPKQDKPIPTSANIDEMRCREHLKTKQQIEELRNEYGDEWLHSKGASKVQDVMGITPNQAPVKQSIQTTEERLENLFGFENTSPINRDRTSTPVQAQLNHADFAHSPIEQFQSPVTSTSDFKSVENSEQKTHKNADDTSSMEKTMFKSTISYDEDLRNLYPSSTTNEPESPSDSEENETIYLVINETNQIDLFLIVSEQSIREKNSLTSKTINKWKMTMLESCEHISTDVIRIRFDTIKRDKRERTYKMEKGEGKKLDDFLRNILSQRPLSDLMLIFRCANCALQFSQEKLQRKNGKDVKCPECGSTYVIEMKDTQSSPTSKRSEQVTLDKSNSHSSIDSASSFNESLSQSKLSNYSQSSFDSNQSLIGSTTNCEHTNDLDIYLSSRFGAATESDVEILSNPSISSIEVLERFSRQSSRKQSEDSRYLLQTQLYLQQHQHQFNKSNDGLDCHSPSLDLLIKSTSNSDIEEILDEPDPSVDSVDQVRITQANETHNANSDHEKIEVNETLLKPKKPMLTCMNLTESSSSGSVTDSVCTAYEHQAADSKATEETTISNIMTSTMTPVEQEQVHIPEIEKKETDTSKLEETSMISNMFGGLFNSTNILMARTTKGSKLEAPPCEKFKFSYKEFDQADHRLKLYLYQHIFEDDNEHLKWLVKGCLFNDTANNDPDAKLQPAIFLMSTTKWYVLNIIGKESDDVTKWVKRDAFGTINRVEQIRVLPWKVGITFTIKHFGHIHFFLQDIMRTDSLLLFFANNPLPVYCDLEYQISERVSQKLLQITNNVQLKMFTILNYCKIIDHNDVSTVYETAAFILTDSNLYVTTPKYGWLVEKMDHARIEVARVQLMTDLVDVENIDETTFAISFLDDVNDIKETWECKFETSSCLQNTFETMATSWEKIFKVPLAN
ncbi:serine/threonine-protein kinase 11-interacting protein isoform X2 [Contarinia nasturtii]|uniref:serine/threonine-protein kinase 11-interacting protein isoform X2 n=1 Tax=Contarinia nasturtii TaxID=265458 RepID=UPI0012D384D8|nr:serine/threonine-protein kinase 11-interacting protein isoform X2 [Contarinia nasturtii]